MALSSESNVAPGLVSQHVRFQHDPTAKTAMEPVTARAFDLVAHAPDGETTSLLSPARFVQALDDEPEQLSLEDKDGLEDKESIRSEQPRGRVVDEVAATNHHVAQESVTLPWDRMVPAPKVDEADDRPVAVTLLAIPTSTPSSRTAFTFPSQETSFSLHSTPPQVTSAQAGDRLISIREAKASAAAGSAEEHQHQTVATSFRSTVPLPVPVCDLGLPASIISSSSQPLSSSSSLSHVTQPVPVSPSRSSSKDSPNTSGNNKGGRVRSISSAARRFLGNRKSSFFKWPSIKEDHHPPTSPPVPPLPPAASTGDGSTNAPVLPPIKPTRALTAPSHLSSLASPLYPSPCLTIAQPTLSAVKVSHGKIGAGANTETREAMSKEPSALRSPLPSPPPSSNTVLGESRSKISGPRKQGNWQLTEDSDDGISDTSSVISDSERDVKELENARGRSLLRVGDAQARTTAILASPTGATSTHICVRPPPNSELLSRSSSSVAVAVTPPRKAGDTVSRLASSLDQIPPREGNRQRDQAPTLKLELPSLSDVNLATLAFSGAEADAGEETEGGDVDVVMTSSPAGTMATLITTSPIATSATLADSEEGQEENKGAKDGKDEARDSFYADAQFLTPEPTPTSSTKGTLSPTFVFPPPGVPRSPLAIPLPPSPVSPTSPQSCSSPLSKRKTILGVIRLVGSVRKGVGSSKKNIVVGVERSGSKSGPARSKTTNDGDREGTKQPKARPHPTLSRQVPDPRRSSTMPPPRSSRGSEEGRRSAAPLSPGTQTRVQIVRKERQPLCPTIHTGGTIQAQTWEIMDEESRRLSEVAFM